METTTYRHSGRQNNGDTSAWRLHHLASVASVGIAAAVSSGQSLTGLGALPEFGSSLATAVSADGLTVVGSSGPLGFRWTSVSGMVSLGTIAGGSSSSPYGTNADGSVVVGEADNPVQSHPFRWTAGGGMVSLGLLPGFTSGFARSVSADGSIVVG